MSEYIRMLRFVRIFNDSPISCVSIQDDTTIAVEDKAFECDGILSDSFQLPPGDAILIAYGHSGSGKTYTMFGNDVLDLVDPLGAVCTFLEVYNEKCFDLLKYGHPLPVRDTQSGTTIVPGLTRVSVNSRNELKALVHIGLENRATAPNGTHERSSRSHAILQVKTRERTIWLVDLAGSERIKNNSDSVFIQKSLLSLHRCVFTQDGYIPVRSSVLTRLLFGKKHTSIVLIACIKSNPKNIDETLATLKFAALKHWPQRKGTSHTDTRLRDALDELKRVKIELEKEKQRAKQLEYQVISSSRPTPIMSPVLDSPISMPKTSPLNDPVMSKTWRHSQYDAILERCWGNKV